MKIPELSYPRRSASFSITKEKGKKKVIKLNTTENGTSFTRQKQTKGVSKLPVMDTHLYIKL